MVFMECSINLETIKKKKEIEKENNVLINKLLNLVIYAKWEKKKKMTYSIQSGEASEKIQYSYIYRKKKG